MAKLTKKELEERYESQGESQVTIVKGKPKMTKQEALKLLESGKKIVLE